MEVALTGLPASFEELRRSEATMLYLPRLPRRAEHSLSRLHQVGFTNVRLEAGIDASVEDPRAVGQRDGWRFEARRTDAEVAFTLSMFRIWQRVIDEQLPYLVIFEDDVLPHPDLERLAPTYWEETPRDADFVLMGNQMSPEALTDRPKRVVAVPAWCLHAYVVTQAGVVRGFDLLRETLASSPDGLAILDADLKRWMTAERIRYACWNGTMLPRALPRSDALLDNGFMPPDVIWAERDTGLFFQNFALGSAMFPEGR